MVSVPCDECLIRLTSLSKNFARELICFITSRGANSDSFEMKVDTDFGPLASLLLNSLPLSSLQRGQSTSSGWSGKHIPQNFFSKLWIVVLLRENLQKLRHRL